MEAQEGYEDGLASDERDTPNRMRSPPLSAPQSLQASLPTTRVGKSRIREGPAISRACTRYTKSHTSPVAYSAIFRGNSSCQCPEASTMRVLHGGYAPRMAFDGLQGHVSPHALADRVRPCVHAEPPSPMRVCCS